MAGQDGYGPVELADLVISARQAQPAGKTFDYLHRHDAPHSFELCKRLFRKERIDVRGGEQVANFVTYRDYGTAAFVLPGTTYQPGVVNVLAKAHVGWAHANSNWSILDEEVLGCRNPEKLVSLVQARRTVAQMDQALLIENELWAAPDVASATQPRTLLFYLVPILGTQVTDTGSHGCDVAGAWQGGCPTGYGDVNAIDPGAYVATTGWDDETYKRWRSYNFRWDNANGVWTETNEERLGWAFEFLQFETPPTVEQLNDTPFRDLRLYTNRTSRSSIWRASKRQNDQVGWDLARGQTGTTFRGLPFVWQRQLDTYTAFAGFYPTVLVNWTFGGVCVRESRFFLERTFAGDKYLPDMTTTHVDLSYQPWVRNRQLFGAMGSYVEAA